MRQTVRSVQCPKPGCAHLEQTVEALRAEMTRLKELEAQREQQPDGQLSLTDLDARSMKSNGRGSGTVGYNVQSAVDTKHHLIVDHEVTNHGSDHGHLYPMAQKARKAMGVDELTAVADRGYYSGPELLSCERVGIRVYVPRVKTSGSRKKGLFTKDDFIYEPEHDRYRCPAKQHLIKRSRTFERGLRIDVYWATESTCRECPMKSQCTDSPQARRVRRWEHEHIMETVEARLNEAPEMMQLRRNTVEHPFGTLKAWMGATHFLTKTLPRVSAEMSLHVLAYNMKRVMNILGVSTLIKAMAAA